MTKLMAWFRYKLARALTELEAADLRALAGPIYLAGPRVIVAHVNVAWRTEQWILGNAIGVRGVEKPRLPQRLADFPHIEGLREWVPAFLTPYQREFILTHGESPGVFGVLGTGAGKTIMGITWALLDPSPIVYITRAAARRTVCSEIRRFTTFEPHLIETTEEQQIPPGTRFIVVGWETLIRHVSAILKVRPATAIFDESHLAASHKRWDAVVNVDAAGDAEREGGAVKLSYVRKQNRFAAAEDIAKATTRHAGFTATPVRDRLKNVWAQLDLITPRAWGKFYDFAKRFCDAHENPWGGIDVNGRTDALMPELQARLSFVTYFVPQSVTHRDLPALRRQVTYIPAHELATGRDVIREAREHANDTAYAKLALAAAQKRPRVVEEAVNAAYRAPDGRSGGKVTIFTGLRADCEKLALAITKATTKKGSEPLKVWWAHGGVTVKDRDAIREEYMAHPGPCVLVATGDSFGESVNLHDSDLYIDAMLPWTPGQVRQREGRFKRLGMTRPVLVLYLVAEGTADEHVAQALLSKLPAVDAVAKDEVMRSFSDDLRGDEEEIAASLLAKLTADDAEEDDDA